MTTNDEAAASLSEKLASDIAEDAREDAAARELAKIKNREAALAARAVHPDIIARAYEKYLAGGQDLVDIAIDLGVPTAYVAVWARDGSWRARRKELEIERYEQAEAQHREFVIKHRLPVLKRHLEAAGAIEELVLKRVNELKDSAEVTREQSYKDASIRRLAETLTAAANVSARAAAITDRPLSKNSDAEQNKKPLVFINLTGVTPVSTITVKED